MNKDSHKGILGINYNSLNLPSELAVKNIETSGKSYYTYTASGVKLRTVHLNSTDVGYTPVLGSTSGDANFDKRITTDYVGNIIYEQDALKRILIDGGYIESGLYYFYVNDHLGNNRVVVGSDGQRKQQNHYYPFGMTFADNPNLTAQPYKYNGKELDRKHGLNMYDYSARHYDPALGRFSTVDPLAEKYYSWSPYNYVGNNPIRRVDPDGKDWIDKLMGVTIGVVTNNLPGSTGLRNVYTPTDASEYNRTLRAVDNVAVIVGAATIVAGTFNMSAGSGTAGAGGIIAASGVGSPVGGLVAGAGGVVVAGGAAEVIGGAVLLGNAYLNKQAGYDYGRVSEASSSKSGGKGSNHLKPSEEATGPHSTFRRDKDGNISNTTTYKENSRNPTGFDEVKRVDRTGIPHRNKSGDNVPTPHVHEKGDVRPANPNEIPKPKR
ncbi:RHS repeat-associated protein [Dysgonomonas sp. PFB1-18]|uniref:RHS repeat-associated core domain-containing protein n=1 Tax=unclassified Dysgonomonas TaxID=2630389 RepID=UPI0024759BE4|nr:MULTISPECIES: RHS repeat-associated core domain-containing protein [unclassified Dysgonomonas]MDH6310480.1 RHS repeat-associated protein [Dysgonomonas sp. PF1-14]MDH6340918.1 RHS repeat-associated protein [Dysgonomonas sp. PF1-16]MDH6382667.1 RHS repeat-associated protein [Dysgonomonas sp. PFB1-18]MDH6399887.1 RHS repeat-associated protein [Dysgonomonas sp. PF1-23]